MSSGPGIILKRHAIWVTSYLILCTNYSVCEVLEDDNKMSPKPNIFPKLSVLHITSFSLWTIFPEPEINEYCEDEYFTAACGKNKAIFNQSGENGRIKKKLFPGQICLQTSYLCQLLLNFLYELYFQSLKSMSTVKTNTSRLHVVRTRRFSCSLGNTGGWGKGGALTTTTATPVL